MKSPLVSVVMAVRNGENHLPFALQSILLGTFDDYEFIVVDDASTDRTSAILNIYARNYGQLCVIRNEHRRERSFSRNRAIRAARGKYLAIMDGDDIAMPNRLEHQAAYLESHSEVAILGSWAHEIDARNRVVSTLRYPTEPSSLRRMMFHTNPFIPSATMLYQRTGTGAELFQEDLTQGEDLDLWWRIVARGCMAMLPECLILYRSNSISLRRRCKSIVVKYKWCRRTGATVQDYGQLLFKSLQLLVPDLLVRRMRHSLHREKKIDLSINAWLARLEFEIKNYIT